MTVTEALAEIKTNTKRIQKKSEFVLAYVWRPENLKDPLEKQGGSFQAVTSERQAIKDLLERTIELRAMIASSNQRNSLTISGTTRTIEQWLVWRREVAPVHQQMLLGLRRVLSTAHAQTVRLQQGQQATDKPAEVTINIDEAAFAKEVENLEDTLGQLDGQLSLKNATITLQ